MLAIAIAGSGLVSASAAHAASLYWDGTSIVDPASWNEIANWSTVNNLDTPDPLAVPGASDLAIFNITTLNTAQTVNLNAAQAAQGLVFNSTGTTSIQSGTGTNTLTLGSSGITVNSGAGAVSIGASLALASSQTWLNTSSNAITIISPVNLGANVLTIAGSGNTVFGQTSTAGSATSNLAIISGAGGSLIKNGTGTLTTSAVNTFNGGATINNGTLVLNMGGAVGTATGAPSLNMIPGTVTVAGATVSTAAAGRLSGSSSNFAYVHTTTTLNVGAGDNAFVQSHGTNARTINIFTNLGRSTGGTLSLTDAFASSSGTNSGGYRMKNATDGNTLVVNGVIPFATYNTSATATSWFVPGITPGTSNNGTAYAAFTVNTATSLGTAAQNSDFTGTSGTTDTVTLASGGGTINTLRFNSGNSHNVQFTNTTDTLVIGAGGILVTGNFANHAARIGNGTGGILMGGQPGTGTANELIIIDNADPAAGSNAFFRIDSVVADNNVNGNSLGVATALTKSGIGLLILNNSANTYTGKNYLNGGITRIVGEGASFGSLGAVPASPVADNVIFTGGTLQLGAAGITINANRGFTLMDKGGTIDSNSLSGTYAGAIAGTGPLTKSGVGTFRLTGASTYSGATTVAAGSLLANNASGSATGTGGVSVAAGASLGGTGIVSGLVSLASSGTAGAGGHIAPGDSAVSSGVGTLTVGSASLTSGSAIDVEFLNNTSYDQLTISGTDGLTIGSGTGINLYNAGTTTAFAPSGDHTYNLFQYSGSFGGSLSNFSILNPVTNLSYVFGTSGGFITLEIIGNPPTSSTWDVDSDGTWELDSNWTNLSPNAIGSTASFLGKITAPRTVSLSTAVTMGTLAFNNANAYTIQASGSGAITLNNGVGATAVTNAGGNHVINAPVALAANTNIGVTNAVDSLTASGNITGIGSLTTFGLGTLILTGTNTYAGNTTIGVGSTLQLGGPGTTTGGTLGGTSVTNNGTLAFARTDVTTFGLPISGTGALVFNGSGTTTLSAASTYSGGTTINAGIVKLGDVASLGTGAVSLSGSGTLDVNGISATLGTIGGSGGIVDNSSATPATLTLGNATSPTFSGVIQNTGAALSLIKAGAGTLTLAGTNTYTGTTTINAGVLKVNADNNLGASTGTLTINAGTFQVATGYSSARPISVANAASTIQVDAGQVYTSIDAAGISGVALVKTGIGTFEVTGPLALSGTATVSNGILTLKSATGNSFGTSPSIAGGTNAAPAELRLDPGATLSLATAAVGTNSVVGLLHVNGGNLTITGNTSLGGVSNSGGGGAITVEAGSTVSLGNVNFAGNDGGNLNFKGGTVTTGTITIPRSGAINPGTSPDYNHGVIVTGGTATIASIALGTGNSWGTLHVNGGAATVTGAFTAGNQTSANRGGAVRVTSGTLVSTDAAGLQLGLQNNNLSLAEFFGGTATLEKILMIHDDAITSGTALVTVGGGGAGGGALYLGSGGLEAHMGGGAMATLKIVGGLIGANADWSGNPNVQFAADFGGGTIQTSDALNNPHNITLSGILSGSGPFNVSGTGTLTTSGADQHTNDTNVNSGTLTVTATGSLGTVAENNINVATGATLNMNGTVDPATHVNVNGGVVNFGGSTSSAAPLNRPVNQLNLAPASLVTVTASSFPFYPAILAPNSHSFADSTATLNLRNNEIILNEDLVTAVGRITSSQIFTTSTGGGLGSLALSPTQTEIRFTLLGDTNLDGKVDVTDLGNLASNYGAVSGATWVQGDTNYSGAVDVTDLGNLASNYGGQLATGPSAGGGELIASSLASVASAGGAAVPEPASIGLLVVGAAGLIGRRNRRRK